MTKIEVMQSKDSYKTKVDMAFDKLMAYIHEYTQEEIESALDELKVRYEDNKCADKSTQENGKEEYTPSEYTTNDVLGTSDDLTTVVSTDVLGNAFFSNDGQTFKKFTSNNNNDAKLTSDDKYDAVNAPSYYANSNIQPIEYIEDRKLGYHLGTAVKYISRAGKKHEEGMTDTEKAIQDLNKAIYFIKRKIYLIENDIDY